MSSSAFISEISIITSAPVKAGTSALPTNRKLRIPRTPHRSSLLLMGLPAHMAPARGEPFVVFPAAHHALGHVGLQPLPVDPGRLWTGM